MTAAIPRRLLAILWCVVLVVGAGCTNRTTRLADEPGSQYVVQTGDTLRSLSDEFHVSVHDLVVANRLRSHQLVPGQVLLLPGVVSAPAEPAAPEPIETPVEPPTVADSSWYLPRSSWAVEPIDTTNILPMTHIYRITVHHSGEESDDFGEPITMLRHFEHIHKHSKNPPWACIGYHFIIARDGRVFEGRPIRYQGAHSDRDNNIGNIGVCLIGDFDRERVPAAQRQALFETLDHLTEQYGISPRHIYGHRELKATDCPGRYLMAQVERYRTGQVQAPLAPTHH